MGDPSGEQVVPGSARAVGLRSHPRMLAMWGVFLSVVMLIDVSVHAYLANRLVLDLGLPAGIRNVALVAVVVLALSMIVGPITQRLRWLGLARAVAWPSYLWMGVMWLALVAVALSDLLLWFSGLAGLLPTSDPEAMLSIARIRAGIVGVLVAGFTIRGLFSALAAPRVRRVELQLPGWPDALDGYRLVQLSDLHLGPLLGSSFARAVTERVNDLRPDAIAVTGDLADGDVPALRPAVAPMGDLRARHGTYFVTGNHDYYSGADPWLDEVRRLGMTPLRNERVALGGDDGFDLAGVDDRQGRTFGPGHGEDLGRALDGRDPTRPSILLAHQPLAFADAAARGVSLMLCGHTHGGQIAPFMLLTRLVYSRYVAGLYTLGRSRLYVSRGTGFWGPPIRLLAPAEITLFELRA